MFSQALDIDFENGGQGEPPRSRGRRRRQAVSPGRGFDTQGFKATQARVVRWR
jgi:hypothetical protein